MPHDEVSPDHAPKLRFGSVRDQSPAILQQRAYYCRTAREYDSMHECTEHLDAIRHSIGYLQLLGAETVLDTGCGTGLAMRSIQRELPEITIRGNDPSSALLRIATDRYGISPDVLDCVPSDALPYATDSFDAVIETGMLHHVPNPERVVSEMLRVARKVVFISDSNMYGQGSMPSRLTKYCLTRLGLLDSVNRLRRNGHDWYYTDGDGVGWSYSLFDTYPYLRSACAQVAVIPTGFKARHADAFPLLFASHCLLIGFKEPIGSFEG